METMKRNEWQKAFSERVEKECNAYRKQADAISVGDVVVNSWGWEQTNQDAYQVTKRTRCTVTLQRIKTQKTATPPGLSSMSARVIPVRGEFIETESPITLRIGKYGIKFKHGGFDVWNGQRSYYESWYA